jgi:pimeloyl-ACP methyl ester carboxylesterase
VPTVRVNDVELFYEETGGGPETIVFSHGLLMDHSMFRAQRAAFSEGYRVIAYDHRGHGQSQDPGRGYDMDTLTTDAAALILALNAAPCHFAGISMGGFVGMRLAARHPALVRTLTLMNTSAKADPWLRLLRSGFQAQAVRLLGPAPFVGAALNRLFGRTTRSSSEHQAMLEEWARKIRQRPRNVAEALMGVMRRKDVTAELSAIRCPTLIIAGEEDTGRPPADSEHLAACIPESRLVRIARSGHSSALEAPEAVITAMRGLLEEAENARANADRAIG